MKYTHGVDTVKWAILIPIMVVGAIFACLSWFFAMLEEACRSAFNTIDRL